MGREEPVDPPARTVRCRTCQAAVHATTVPVAPLRLPRALGRWGLGTGPQGSA